MSIELQNQFGLTPPEVAAAEVISTAAVKPPRPSRTRLQFVLRELRRAPLTAWFGIIVIAAYLLVAVFAPVLAPYGQSELVGSQYEPWSAQFIFGTDQLGRDMLSRLIYGARNTIGIAVVTTALSFALGGMLGLLAAVLGGWTDQLLSRMTDVLMSIPQLIFALVLLSIFGPSVTNLILIIAVLDSTRVFRLTRAVAMNVAVLEFVEAARLQGERILWIMMREVLPNIMPPLVAEFGLRFCFVFLTISALSFLGLGIQPPTADWGSMVSEARAVQSVAWWNAVFPGLAIVLFVTGANLMGEGLRQPR